MNQPSSTTVDRAEQILAAAFGRPIRLGEGHDLGGSARSQVLRFPVLEGPRSAPESIIVKQCASQAFDPSSTTEATWRFFKEWATLQFLRQVVPQPPLVPALYGGDQQTGLLVMEDVQPSVRLDQLLLATDPVAAEAGLLAYAELHGRLHALTSDRQADYLQLRERLGPAVSTNPYYTYRWLHSALQEITTLLEVPVQPGADEELETLVTALVTPGPFLAVVQSDAAPDNFLFNGASWRMIDFEGARYCHALLEGVYCRMPFPTCWCVYRLPEGLISRLEARYRTELARGCPAAADEGLFSRGVVEACLMWALNFHHMLRPLGKMLEQDRLLAALTDRQRFLLYLQAAAEASERFDHLTAVGRTVRACASQLAERWPEATDPPYYPAFSERAPQQGGE